MPELPTSNEFNAYLAEWQKWTGKDYPKSLEHQKDWTGPIHQAELSKICDDMSLVDKVRMISASSKHSGDWLKAVPCRTLGLHLEDEEFRNSLCIRLGTPIFQPHKCQCGQLVDEHGDHSFACRKNNGKILRHSMINDCFSRGLKSAKLPNITEPVGLPGSQHLRPDGITVIPFKEGKSLAWDVTCPHPICSSWLHRVTTGKSATEEVEQRKKKKYAQLQDRYIFTPIAIDTIGAYGPDTKIFLQDICRRLVKMTDNPKAGSQFRQRLSIAVQRGNSKTLSFSLFIQ